MEKQRWEESEKRREEKRSEAKRSGEERRAEEKRRRKTIREEKESEERVRRKSQKKESQKKESQKKGSEERARRKKMQVREKVEKLRFTVFSSWFVAPEGRKVSSLKRRVQSRLARWKSLWHAVVARSTCRSQNVQSTPFWEHFWKLRWWKSAGAKHISKSKV